jgi:3-phenylpropionate/cinnamic acid dioxygenase small subunit
MTTTAGARNALDPVEEAAARAHLAQYAHRVDDRKFEQCVAMFADDAQLTVNGEHYNGRQEITAWYESLKQMPESHHIVTNTVFGAHDSHVTALSDWAFVMKGDTGWQIVAIGRYDDVLARTSSGHLFTRRTIITF